MAKAQPYLGIDIGGTGIKGALVDVQKGELVVERFRIDTPQPATPDAVAKTVAEIVGHFKYKGTVGCTFPAVVRHGIVYSAANVDKSWIETDADKLFEKATGCSVHVMNDADAAGVAEVAFGAGKGKRGVVMLLTFGTGIGSALFTNGVLVPNTELGHLELDGKEVEPRMSEKAREDLELSWKKWAKRVNSYLNCLERLFSPDLFIIGGGASKKSDKFFPLLELKTPIVTAQLLNEAGIVGAAYVAKQLDEGR
ncbi:MAG: polyphosphate--glucose phosphotransferase [Trueperaceae bacterium]